MCFFFSDGGLEVHQELLKNAVRATTERHRLLGSNLKLPQNWTVKCSYSWMDNFGKQVQVHAIAKRNGWEWCGCFTVLFQGCKGPAFFIFESPFEATWWLGWHWLYIKAIRWYDFLSDPEKRCALGKFGLLQVGKYSKGGSNPRFLIDLATVDLLSLWGSWSSKERCSRDHQNQRPGGKQDQENKIMWSQ